MKNRKKLFFGIVCISLFLSFKGLNSKEFDEAILNLKIKEKEIQLPILLAKTPNQRANGLMFFKDLGEHKGMLFIFDEEEEIFMWMKNTNLPLDMIFFNKDGEVVSTHKGAKPHSLSLISSKYPCQYVLEVLAGDVNKIGVDLDSKIIFIKNENKVLQFKK